MDFKPAHMEMFRRYEEVRQEGNYNMFDPRARQLTGLGRADYHFVIKNYNALKAQYDQEQKEQQCGSQLTLPGFHANAT